MDQLRGDTLTRLTDFWQTTLSGAPALLQLPCDHPRPMTQTYRGAKRRLTLSTTELESLKALAHRTNATLFMVLLTAFKVLLSRYSGQDDVVVGTPVAGRSLVETEQMVGLFIKTVPLRTDLSANPTFLEAVTRVREVALEAYAHQDLPFSRIVDVLRPARDSNRHPIFQVMFNLENVPKRAHAFRGLDVEPIDLDYGVAPLDLTLEVTEEAGCAYCTFVYNTGTSIDLPQTIDEVTDPRWAGQVGVAPTNGSFLAFVSAMILERGEDATLEWLRALAANSPGRLSPIA